MRYEHVNRFLDYSNVNRIIEHLPVELVSKSTMNHVQYYPDAIALMKSIKQIGATHIHRGGTSGLTGKNKFKRVVEAFEMFRDKKGIPLTYRAGYFVLRKN